MRAPLGILVTIAILAACDGSPSSARPDGGAAPIGAVATLPRPAVFADLPLVTLLAPGALEAGRAPTFEWSAVDAAAAYRLSVLGPDGPTWAWQGGTTSVRYGGVPNGTSGPSLLPGSWWSVAALAGDDTVLALSELRAVAPSAERGPNPNWTKPPSNTDSPDSSASPPSGMPDAGSCDLLTREEIGEAIGGDWLEPTEKRLDARYGWCDWRSARGTLLTLTISPAAHFDPAGWGADEPIADLGDEAHWAAAGWDRRILFVQGDLSAMLAIDFSRVDRVGFERLARLIATRLEVGVLVRAGG